MPDFSDPTVQFNIVMLILGMLSTTVAKRVPVLGPFISAVTKFLKNFAPVPKPVDVSTAAPVANAPYDEISEPLPPQVMDRTTAVMHVTELSEYWTDHNPDPAGVALANQMYARLHTLKTEAAAE